MYINSLFSQRYVLILNYSKSVLSQNLVTQEYIAGWRSSEKCDQWFVLLT